MASTHSNRPQLGIVFALPIEAHAFEGMAHEHSAYRGTSLTIHEGQFASQRVCWTVSGVGRAAATSAARMLSEGHRPRRLLSAGFAGGISPALTKGQLVFPARVIAEHAPTCPPVAVDATLADTLWRQTPPDNLTLVSVEKIASSPAAKAAIREATSADLLDMEATAVAAVAAENQLPFLTVRVISDTATESLPPEVSRLCQPQSSLHRFGAALSAVARRPSAAIDFWKLWEEGLLHSRTLADGLLQVVEVTGRQPSSH
jgi:adenosylhomocysteine nucleosidase